MRSQFRSFSYSSFRPDQNEDLTKRGTGFWRRSQNKVFWKRKCILSFWWIGKNEDLENTDMHTTEIKNKSLVSKKCRQIGVFRGLVWTVETDDANTLTLFQRYYRDTSTWNPLESSYFKATEPFNVSCVDLSEYSISVQCYLAISFPKSIGSWSRGT